MSKLEDQKPASRIEEHDRLVINLSTERAMRLQAQHELAAKHIKELAVQRQSHAEKHTALVGDLRNRYALGERDDVDLETGAITRAAPAADEAAEKKES